MTRPVRRTSRPALLAVAVVAALAVTTLVSPATTPAAADPEGRPDLAPRLTAATFADPPATVRPKYRWWLPMAFTEDDQLRRELADMKAIGAGGAEVASFAVSGPEGSDPDFLAENGWGSPKWAQKVRTMLQEAARLGLGLDLTIGPRWPALVPTVTDVNDPRAAQQLVFSYEVVEGGGTFEGQLPDNYSPAPPGGAERHLVAALLARCADDDCAPNASGTRLLDREEVVDVTDKVRPDESLRVDVPGDASASYVVIAFFQTGDGEHRNNLTTTSPNYYLDQLSKQGVDAVTDFYESDILTPEVREALAATGRVDLYEDSLELGGSQKWTWDFLDQWRQRRGYDPTAVLPAIAGTGAQGLSERPAFDFDDGSGKRIRTDYRQTWSDVYISEHLDTLRSWANEQGMALRAQPYGYPVDTARASGHVDVPEGESLAFNHNVEDYKLLAVGAHLEGNPVVSNECCATREKVWATTAGGRQDPGNLHAVYRGFAGGVTQVVWHGYPYLSQGRTGTSATSRWPGMSYGGNTSFAEAWGAKGGPNWADYKAINDNIARLQLVLRQGQPRFDVAVYWQDFGMTGHGTTGAGEGTLLTSDSPLAEHGYTWEYLSPAHLTRNDVGVEGGRLLPGVGDFGALVVKDQSTMPVQVARRLVHYAGRGLPVVIVGDLPSTTPGHDRSAEQDRELRQVVQQLVRQPNVTRVGDLADVPGALARQGVRAAAAPTDPSADLLSVRRADDTTSYYYLFNQTSWETEQEITLRGKGKPFRLDTWTGKIEPITDYHSTPDGVRVRVQLRPTDTEVIALTTRNDDTFRWRGAPGHGPVTAKNTGLGPVTPTDWTLDVQGWSAGPSGAPGDTTKQDLPTVRLEATPNGTLPPWSQISPETGHATDLRDVSGVGTYRSTFRLDDGWQEVRGAHLDLGTVVDTATVAVNGTPLPPLDPQDLRHLEVGHLLRPGQNTVTVRVASTLLNAVRVAPGTGAQGRERMDYGLLGPVRLTPYDARQPTLGVEALETELPLAAGGQNVARIRVTNSAPRPAEVTFSTIAPDGVDAVVAPPRRKIPGRGSEVVEVRLSGSRSTGSSTVSVTARADNGATGAARLTLRHSTNLAWNTTGSPFPRSFTSSNQDRYPASFATDGDESTFWVSGGYTPGQAPTAQDPEVIGVDLGVPTTVRAVGTVGRGDYSLRGYDVQTSLDGRTWKTVGSEQDAPKTGTITPVTPGKARYVRLRISEGWYPTQPGNNTQLRELAVYSSIGNLAWLAEASASSTHSKFSVAAVNDGSLTGQHDYDIWNAGFGWNDADRATWPDTLTLTWDAPQRISSARVHTVDNGTNPASGYGLRDYDVQAFVGGEWRTVASVRDSTEATTDVSFPAVTTTRLRLLVTDTNDHAYSRVVELEARG